MGLQRQHPMKTTLCNSLLRREHCSVPKPSPGALLRMPKLCVFVQWPRALSCMVALAPHSQLCGVVVRRLGRTRLMSLSMGAWAGCCTSACRAMSRITHSCSHLGLPVPPNSVLSCATLSRATPATWSCSSTIGPCLRATYVAGCLHFRAYVVAALHLGAVAMPAQTWHVLRRHRWRFMTKRAFHQYLGQISDRLGKLARVEHVGAKVRA